MPTQLFSADPEDDDQEFEEDFAEETRPQSHLPQELRRRQLIATAAHVFSSKGYQTTSMEHIAQASHITKPELYQYFTGKRDLYMAVLDEQVDGLLTQLVQPLYNTTDNRERVRGMISAFFSFARNNASGYHIIFDSDLHADPAVLERLETVHQMIAHHIADVLAPNAGISHREALLTARMLTGMVLSATRAIVGDPNNDEALAESERTVFRLAWGGISQLHEDWE
ncbi:TetR/AcrR family transcriptional regulator [Rothia nasimurium]|uniref:TetR/AcrR family transcriptional regulator n=1 Tax=Rothia nasimurium TaxID=85336 RepID=UPI003BA1DAC6